MDPLSLLALTNALLGVLNLLAGSAAGRGVELLAEAGADQAKARDELRDALQTALNELAADPHRYVVWFNAFSKLHENQNLVKQVAEAIIGMVQPDPMRVKAEMLAALGLPAEERPHLANFLSQFREQLSGASQFQGRIQNANALHGMGQLDRVLAEISTLSATVTPTPSGPAIRVEPVSKHSEQIYLEKFAESFKHLDLFRRDDKILSGEKVRLNQVYIALDTTNTRVPKTERQEIDPRLVPVSALGAVFSDRRLVLLGAPGSGKSTFVQHLCLNLAQARRGLAGWAEQMQAGPADEPDRWLAPYALPIFVRLREFARDTESFPSEDIAGSLNHLLRFIEKNLKRLLGASEFIEPVRAALESGEALAVFDGLDEVTHPQPNEKDPIYSDQQRRRQVVEAIQSFSSKFDQARILVTCRTQVYPTDDAAGWRLKFPTATLRPFSEEQIKTFVHHWFAEMQAAHRLKGDPQTYETQLLTALETKEQLDELAQEPFLLTQMALLVGREGQLPAERVDLYEECARYLLWEWEDTKAFETERESSHKFIHSLGVTGLKRDDVQNALDMAAWRGLRDGLTELPEAQLKLHLSQKFLQVQPSMSEHRAETLADQFIEQWLLDRNGLFRPASERSFGFPHKTFHEFLAARCLVNNSDPAADDWQAELPKRAQADPTYWREVFRFAASYARNSKQVATALQELCPTDLTPETAPLTLLAARVLADVGLPDVRQHKAGQMMYAALEPQLINLMRDSTGDYGRTGADKPNAPTQFAIINRFEASLLLESLGWNIPDLYHFVQVSYPPSAVHRPPSFLIAKYPVTNAQYARFVAADDYAAEDLWRSLKVYDHQQQAEVPLGDKAWEWFRQNEKKQRRPSYWDNKQFGQQRRLAPVVGVTWYEAAAYCEWLTRHWPELDEAPILQSLITDNHSLVFRLPLENEWVLAAGGEGPRVKIKEGGKNIEISVRYPWQAANAAEQPSQEEIFTRANVEGQLGATSPVNMYLAGASQPHGLMDMAGNVWEWQANFLDKGNDTVALRGGAWAAFRTSPASPPGAGTA